MGGVGGDHDLVGKEKKKEKEGSKGQRPKGGQGRKGRARDVRRSLSGGGK